MGFNSLGPGPQQCHKGRFTGSALDDPTATAVLAAEQEVIRQLQHPSEPVHHDHLELGASRARNPRRIICGKLIERLLDN